MNVVITTLQAATDTRPARVRVQCGAGSLFRAYDQSLDVAANHHLAAHMMIAKLENGFGGWAGEWVAGESIQGQPVVYWVNTTWATTRMMIGTNPKRNGL